MMKLRFQICKIAAQVGRARRGNKYCGEFASAAHQERLPGAQDNGGDGDDDGDEDGGEDGGVVVVDDDCHDEQPTCEGLNQVNLVMMNHH